jgi:hypothetical protein
MINPRADAIKPAVLPPANSALFTWNVRRTNDLNADIDAIKNPRLKIGNHCGKRENGLHRHNDERRRAQFHVDVGRMLNGPQLLIPYPRTNALEHMAYALS